MWCGCASAPGATMSPSHFQSRMSSWPPGEGTDSSVKEEAAVENPARLMAVSPLQLDVPLINPALTAGVSSIAELRQVRDTELEKDGFPAVCSFQNNVWCGKIHTSSGEGGVEERWDKSSQRQDPTRLWDKSWDKRRFKPSDLGKYDKSRLTTRRVVNSWQKPVQVEAERGTLNDGAKKRPFESTVVASTQEGGFAAGSEGGRLEVDVCWKLCDDGRTADAVNALEELLLVQQRGHRRMYVPNNLFYRLLKRSSSATQKDLALGRRIHALSVECRFEGDAFLATHLMGMYARHGRLEEASAVFSKVPVPDSHNWATIIFAHARHGEAARAIQLYRQMRREKSGVEPDSRVFTAVLKACVAAGDFDAGKEVHAHILASPGFNPDAFVLNGLLDLYVKCGRSVDDARSMFDALPSRNVVTWTTMIGGYAQHGMGEKALALYNDMKQEGRCAPDSVTFICLLQACASLGEAAALDTVKMLHAEILQVRGLQDDVTLGGSLVHMYAQCGSIQDARAVFNRLPRKNAVTWNTMITGYGQQGLGEEALSLYDSMLQEGLTAPDCVTFLCLLQACASIGVGALHQGRKLHMHLEKETPSPPQGTFRNNNNMMIGCSLVNMYAKCGSVEDARAVFDRMAERNVVAWTAMISGYVQQGMGQEALNLYNRMQEEEGFCPPDSVTFVCLLQACAGVGAGALHYGKQLHAQVEEQGLLLEDVVVGGSLVNMYAKCGGLEDARRVFDALPERNVVTWNAMIAGYAQQGKGQEALDLYRAMQQRDGGGLAAAAPSCVTFVSLLQACGCIGVGALADGKQLHAQIEEQGGLLSVDDDLGGVLGSSLVNMYAKCGPVEDARSLFDRLAHKSIGTWNAMLAGYVQQGKCQEALDLFYSGIMMKDGTGACAAAAAPDSVTFVCALQACAGVGVGALHLGRQIHEAIVEQQQQQGGVLLLQEDDDGGLWGAAW